MAEIIARFVDGRLLVQEERVMELNPTRRELFRGHPRIHVVMRRIDQPPAAKRQDKV